MTRSKFFIASKKRLLTAVVTAALVTTAVSTAPGEADAAARRATWEPPTPDDVTQVDGVVPARWNRERTWSADGSVVRPRTDVVWPDPADLTVALDTPAVDEGTALGDAGEPDEVVGTRAGDLPVWIAPISGHQPGGSPTTAGSGDAGSVPPAAAGAGQAAAVPPSEVDVRVHDRATTSGAGVLGVVLEVGRADGVEASATTAVTVDYGGFANAAGGDWASRLRMVQLPTCAATTPGAEGCSTPTLLPSVNDPADQMVTAVVPLGPGGEQTMVALAAGPAGDNGDYSASSLTPASTWDVSTQTGAFTWSHPLRMVPSVGGPTPDLAFSYSSQTMDGRTGGFNTQGSWVGDGFDLWPGFVERSYRSCAEDTAAVNNRDPNNANRPTGDQCWWKANATLSLNGRATELVEVSTGVWKGQADDGSKVELVPGAPNGDDNGEHWKVTTIDGTQYFFGRHTGQGGASASTATDSTWTTPVYGNHLDEPGHVAGNFAASRKTQAWRWNLDYVVDPSGNTMTLFYDKETGAYGRELDPQKRTSYDRGGYLDYIEYGNRANADSSTHAAARVELDVAERCLEGATCFDSNGKPVLASFPDTPWDQYCRATPCTDQLSPTFWTQKRLQRVRTQVHTGNGSYSDVESWTLRHEYLDAGRSTNEGTPMFLRGITHKGHVTTAGGEEETDPEILFDPGAVPLPNRVDGPADNRTALKRWRIKRITTETGGQILVDYRPAECTRGALPVVHANTQLCFPQYYAPEGQTPKEDWFHKYVVARVTANDNAAGSTPQITSYEYLDRPAWHFDDSELVKENKRTWGQFRGFSHVRTRQGTETEVQLATEERFLRGMDGDRQATGVGVRDVWVEDSWGNRIEDHDAYAGRSLEQTTLDGANGPASGPWVQGTITIPTAPAYTGGSGTLKAWMVNTATTRTYSRTTVEPDGVRWTRSDTLYNADNLPYETDDLGDETTPDDDRCTRTWYARNSTPGNWMLDRIKRTETVGVACTATPSFPDDMVSSTRTTYDNPNGNWDTHLPTRGLPVKIEEIDHWTGDTPAWVTTSTTTYDDNGRATLEADALGRTTQTTYTPREAGPVTRTVVANPLEHRTTTDFAPEWNQPRTVTNHDGAATQMHYDGLGRLAKVWLPGRSSSDPPSHQFDYDVRNTTPTAVTSRRLTATSSGTGYATQISLYDGWLRERQTQTQAPGGGRTITETHYNSRGETWWTAAPYYDATDAAPETTLLTANRAAMPSVTEHAYDGAGRQTVEALHGFGRERWRTVTEHLGDLTVVTPPAGGTRTGSLLDARGQTVEERRYHQRTGTPQSAFDRTTYTYTDAGQPATVTDAAGNVWRHMYDQRGREVRTEDPDRGVTRATYDAAGQRTSNTDARGVTLATTYDALGRRTAVRDGSTQGPIRAEWNYDTLPNGTGRLTSSVRHHEGRSYIDEITEYDQAGRPKARRVTVPSSEGALCAAGGDDPCTYSYSTSYKADGQIATTLLPKIGDLAAEQLTQHYNDVGAPSTITASSGTLLRSVYYDKTGRLTQRTLGAPGRQVITDHIIDDTTNRLAETNVAVENQPSPRQVGYTHDDAGNVTRIHNAPTGSEADTQCYSYDHLRRLVDAWTPRNSDCAPRPTVADLGGPAPYWHSYEYTGAAGATGSRTRETWHSTGGNTTRTYTYPGQAGPPGSRPHTLDEVHIDNPTIPDTVDTNTYDPAGNTATRTVQGVEQTLTWDAENHLASLTADGGTTEVVYDADGNRLIRRDPEGTGTTLYLPHGQEVNVSPGAGTATGTRYYQHAGTPIGVRTKARGLTFVIGDHHNTGELAIKASDLTAVQRRTLPFGDTRGAEPTTWPGDKSFVGGTQDPHNLVHLGARTYDPPTGRFLSADPVVDPTDPQQMHGYAYANNAPPTHTDPTGLRYEIGDGGGNSLCTGTPDRCADKSGLNGPLYPCKATPDRCADNSGQNGRIYPCRGTPDRCADKSGLNTGLTNKLTNVPTQGPNVIDRLNDWNCPEQDWWCRRRPLLPEDFWTTVDWGRGGAALTNMVVGGAVVYKGIGKVSGSIAAALFTEGGCSFLCLATAAYGVGQIYFGTYRLGTGIQQWTEFGDNPGCEGPCTVEANVDRYWENVLGKEPNEWGTDLVDWIEVAFLVG